MSGEDDDTDKEHAPTQKRLDDARARGDFARSPDLISAAALGGFVLAIIALGPSAFEKSATAAMAVLDRADGLSAAMHQNGQPLIGAVLSAMLIPLIPFVAAPAVAVLLALFVTRGWVFSTEKITPKLSKVSPLANARQKFGLDGLFEFAKSTLKLLLMSALLYWFFRAYAPDILTSMSLTAAISTQLLLQLLTSFIIIALLVSGIISGADFGWQIYRHQQRNMMSRKEMMDEMKESEGDPHTKAQRRQRAQEIATNRMLADVPSADVIIVNPTHYAVALKWKRGSKTAPLCVAKGVDEIAAQIRARAAENGVPIHSDPPTARAIHASVEVGQPIKSEHFKAVATAIRFAEAMRAKARKMWKVT